MEMDQRHEPFLRKNGIKADAFCCPHAKACRSYYSETDNFKTATEPYVGEEYAKPGEQVGVPRLSFIT